MTAQNLGKLKISKKGERDAPFLTVGGCLPAQDGPRAAAVLGGLAVERDYLGAGLESVQEVSPGLHHLMALG